MSIRVPHRIVVAPSGFKESLDAEQVAAAISAGVRRALPGAVVTAVPMVDGGEGTARTLAAASGGSLVPVHVTGPVGTKVLSHFAILGGSGPRTAVVEMAAAAGLRLVPAELRDPSRTTSYGVGELILAALDHGAEKILIGCGDSGTSDGGAGLVAALGGRLLDSAGQEVAPDGGAVLARVAHLDLSGLDTRVIQTPIEVGCNMTNVLTGPRGVARVFGPQKGATPEQVDLLARGLDCWATVLEEAVADQAQGALRDHRVDVCGPGSGASGGLGAALLAVCGARLRSRFEVFLSDELGTPALDAAIAQADLVITAEGAVDYQTPKGKVPAEIARRSKMHGKPVMALAGSIGQGATDVHDVGIDAVVGIIPIPMELAQAVERASELVAEATERAMRLVLLGSVISAA